MKTSWVTRQFLSISSRARKTTIRMTVVCIVLPLLYGGGFAGGIPLTHVPGRPPTGKFHNIPTHPSAKTLSRVVLKPDLTIEKIRISQKGRGQAEAVITIKNTGKGTSPATRASVILIRGDKTKAKGALSVKILKVGEDTTLH